MRRTVTAALLGPAAAIAGCTSDGPGAALPPCPRTTAATIRGAARPIAEPLALGPSAVKVCAYGQPQASDQASVALAGSTTLTGDDARTFVALADFDTSSQADCDLTPTVMYIRYRHATVTAEATGCEPALLSGPRGVTVSRSVVLEDLYSPPLSGRGLPVPSVVGDSLPRAVARLARFYGRHPGDVGAYLGGSNGKTVPIVLQASEYPDRGATLGRVIFQSPLPSLPNDPLNEIDVLVATPPEPRCTARQLTGLWSGDSFGTGDTFGGLSFADRSATACSLTGRLSVEGVARDGAADTTALSWRLPTPFVLSPRAHLTARDLTTEATLTGFVGLAGDSRDGPGPTGLCEHETVPAAWRIRVDGLRLDIANGPDRHLDGVPYGEIMAKRDAELPFFSCGGNLIRTLGTAPQIDN